MGGISFGEVVQTFGTGYFKVVLTSEHPSGDAEIG